MNHAEPNASIELPGYDRDHYPVQIYTLGGFRVIRDGINLSSKDWGRDKSIQLLQFLVSNRSHSSLRKEQIIDRLWEEATDRDFKVAMHGVNKALEPNRPSRTDPRYISRNGLSYQLNLKEVWIDINEAESLISEANRCLSSDQERCKLLYHKALALYKGTYLPNRLYEDWTSEERERMQVLFLGAYTDLAQLLIQEQPMEAVRLTQAALQIEPVWEDAYRIQIEAYISRGNRPMALKTYEKCETVLMDEYGIKPLPQTQSLIKKVKEL